MQTRAISDEPILIFAPVGRDAELLSSLFQSAGLVSTICASAVSLAQELKQGAGAVLVTSEAFSQDVAQILTDAVDSQPTWSDLPLVFLAERVQNISDGALRRYLGVNANLTFLARPVQPTTLLTLFQSLLQARRRQYQVRDLLLQLAAQNEALQQERSQLQELTETLEIRVREGTQQVRTLAAQLSLAEHGERKRISQILHDYVQQMLYGVQMRVHMARMDLSEHNITLTDEHLGAIQKLVDESVHAVRTLSVELSPPILENEGLPEALLWLCHQMKELHALTTQIQTWGDCSVADKHLRVVVFQVLRELLFNVVKHAHTDKAWITLHRHPHELQVSIRDEGVGFEPNLIASARDSATGFGLSSIEERLDLFNGQMQVLSAPGQGTTVKIRLPL